MSLYKEMTVKDLIKMLKDLPPDHAVCFLGHGVKVRPKMITKRLKASSCVYVYALTDIDPDD